MLVKSSYEPQDVTFLLKDLSHISLERATEEREKAIQSGIHYSEMLPIEYQPSETYWQLYYDALAKHKKQVAIATGVVSESIMDKHGICIVLVSLVRAGTPIGILIKRYLQQYYKVNIPHYSISIIRGKGIDYNALQYIINEHPTSHIVFIDGWTGKGAITQQLITSIKQFNQTYNTAIEPALAVLADPAYCATYYGTRKDFLIPSACLNSVVSGLVSRSVLHDEWIGPDDYHGAKSYPELKDQDVSREYIATIVAEFISCEPEIQQQYNLMSTVDHILTWQGMQDIKQIQDRYRITDHNLVKPGVGETTRVLLRRIPWKILVRDSNNPDLAHIIQLAHERGVKVESYPAMTYACCGLIEPM